MSEMMSNSSPQVCAYFFFLLQQQQCMYTHFIVPNSDYSSELYAVGKIAEEYVDQNTFENRNLYC